MQSLPVHNRPKMVRSSLCAGDASSNKPTLPFPPLCGPSRDWEGGCAARLAREQVAATDTMGGDVSLIILLVALIELSLISSLRQRAERFPWRIEQTARMRLATHRGPKLSGF